MIRCARCGRENIEGVALCGTCGAPLVAARPAPSRAPAASTPGPGHAPPAPTHAPGAPRVAWSPRPPAATPAAVSVRCPGCGAAVPPGFKFCGGCGSPIGPPAPRAAAPTPGPSLSVPGIPVAPRRARAKVVMPGPDGSAAASFALYAEETTIGSSGEVRLSDPCAEAVEGRFLFRGSQLYLVAEASLNGLFVLLKREHELHEGSELRIGRQLLRIEAMPRVAPPAEPLWGSANPGYRLRAVQMLAGGVEGDVFPLREGDSLVGRTAGDLSFPGDGYVSSRHAVISVHGDRAVVHDLGSSNGTFVRVEREAHIDPGDLLLVGEQLLRVDPP